VLRAHIVRAILGTGLFTWGDTRVAAATFALLVLSLAAQGITLLFVRGYYAAEKTWVPLCITALTGLSSVFLAVGFASLYTRQGLFYYFLHDVLRLATYDDASIALLALGMSVSNICGAVALVAVFSYTFKDVGAPMFKAFRDGFVGAVFAGTGAYATLTLFKQIYGLTSFFEILFQGFVAGSFGCLLGGAVLYLIGNKEVREVYAALHGHASKLARIRIKGAEAHSE
jgi:peptidoglycan biosynthesis protein MviN/MurJ (putative lipid II flippase)